MTIHNFQPNTIQILENPSRPFVRCWSAIPKMYMEMKKIQNSQEELRSHKTHNVAKKKKKTE